RSDAIQGLYVPACKYRRAPLFSQGKSQGRSQPSPRASYECSSPLQVACGRRVEVHATSSPHLLRSLESAMRAGFPKFWDVSAAGQPPSAQGQKILGDEGTHIT